MESFEELVEQCKPMIYKVIHTFNIYKDEEEYFQTGVIGLWEAKERYDPERGNFSTIAYTYIRGRILDELKKRNRIEERSAYPDEDFWLMKIDENAEHPFELATLLTYCNGLTPKQKQWVIDTFYLGLTLKEIAKKEKVSESAVKKWRKQAMEKIKENIEKRDESID